MYKTITEINAAVEILGVEELHWGAEVIARVVDTGMVGKPESLSVEAASLAYRQRFEISEDEFRSTKKECVMPALGESGVWYTHIKVFKKNCS